MATLITIDLELYPTNLDQTGAIYNSYRQDQLGLVLSATNLDQCQTT